MMGYGLRASRLRYPRGNPAIYALLIGVFLLIGLAVQVFATERLGRAPDRFAGLPAAQSSALRADTPSEGWREWLQ